MSRKHKKSRLEDTAKQDSRNRNRQYKIGDEVKVFVQSEGTPSHSYLTLGTIVGMNGSKYTVKYNFEHFRHSTFWEPAKSWVG